MFALRFRIYKRNQIRSPVSANQNIIINRAKDVLKLLEAQSEKLERSDCVLRTQG